MYNISHVIRYPRIGVAYRKVFDVGLLVTIKLSNQSGKIEVNWFMLLNLWLSLAFVLLLLFFSLFYFYICIQWIVRPSSYEFWIPFFLIIYSTTIFAIRKDGVRSNKLFSFTRLFYKDNSSFYHIQTDNRLLRFLTDLLY